MQFFLGKKGAMRFRCDCHPCSLYYEALAAKSVGRQALFNSVQMANPALVASEIYIAYKGNSEFIIILH